MKSLIIILLVNLIAHSALFAQVNHDTLTLKASVDLGLQQNQRVRESAILMQREEIAVDQAKKNIYPTLTAIFDQGINSGRSIDPFTNSFSTRQITYAGYGLRTNIVLYNGFKLRNQIDQTSLSLQAAQKELEQEKNEVTIQVILAYLDVLNTQDMLAQTAVQANLTKRQVERLRILQKEGNIARYLLSEIEGQYANDQLAIVNIKESITDAKLRLFELLNIPFSEDIVLEKIMLPLHIEEYTETPDQIYETALKSFSLVSAANLRRESAVAGIKAAKGNFLPTISFNGYVNTGYSDAARISSLVNTTNVVTKDYVVVNGTNYPLVRKQDNYESQKIAYGRQLGNNLYTSVSINFNFPIFNSFRARNNYKLSKIELKQSDLILASTKNALHRSIEKAYQQMLAAREKYRLLQEQVFAFQESFRAAEIRFNEGVTNSIEYLTAKNNLDRTILRFISSKYDLLLRSKILDYYQGKSLW